MGVDDVLDALGGPDQVVHVQERLVPLAAASAHSGHREGLVGRRLEVDGGACRPCVGTDPSVHDEDPSGSEMRCHGRDGFGADPAPSS